MLVVLPPVGDFMTLLTKAESRIIECLIKHSKPWANKHRGGLTIPEISVGLNITDTVVAYHLSSLLHKGLVFGLPAPEYTTFRDTGLLKKASMYIALARDFGVVPDRSGYVLKRFYLK